jgi:raffinose/stachyose/melibiose transport system substrate-binding protein
MHSKWFKVVSLLVLAGLLLAACAAPTPEVVEKEVVVEKPVVETVVVEKEVEVVVTATPQEEVVLNLWLEIEGESVAFDQEIVDTFNEMHKGRIKVEGRMIPDDQWFTALRIGVTGGSPPDVFWNEGGSQLQELIDADAVMPLDDWWEGHKEGWIEGAQVDNYFNGKLYSIHFLMPRVRDLLAWNVDLLDKYGVEPPGTWDEWMEAMETVKEQGGVPFAVGNKAGWPGGHLWQTIHLRIGGAERQLKAMDRDGVHWTEPDFIKAAELYAEIGERGFLSPGFAADDFVQGDAYFRAGNAVFQHIFDWNVQDWGEPGEILNYGWDRFPQIPPMIDGDPGDAFVTGSGGYAVSSKTKHPEEALDLLEYLLSLDVLKKRMAFRAFASSRIGVVDPADIPPRIKRVQEVVGETKGRIPYIVLHMDPAIGRQVFDVGSLAVWTGDITPREWMEQMEEAHAELTGTEAVLNP